MKVSLRFLCGMVCAAFITPVVANVATTAGSNLTAYNGTGAMNNNQWNSMMNMRGNMPSSTTAAANFGNCNAVILRCATPKCSSGSCSDMAVARPIVAGCVNSNNACKQYGNDLIEYISAQIVAQSNAKIIEQENAIAMAQAQATAQANATAAAQSNAQIQQMQSQMAQMQSQMAESMAAMQEQMRAQSETQNAQIQNALAEQRSAAAATTTATGSTGDTGAVIAGLEGLGVAEQLAAKNGISADILVREQMGGQIETAVEDAMVQMKKLKTTLDNILEYAGCDASANSCTGPRRVKKFKDLANEFFDPYEEVIDNMYEALMLAMTVGIDVSDVIMLLSDSCNIWGKYVCEPCSSKGFHGSDGECACYGEDNNSNCYWRVVTGEDGTVAKRQSHCRLVGTLNEKSTIYREWIDANSGLTGSTQVACASDVIGSVGLFRGRRKNATIDIETLRDLVNQDSYVTCRNNASNAVDGDLNCGVQYCAVEPLSNRYKRLETAANTKKLPSDCKKWRFDSETRMINSDDGATISEGEGYSRANSVDLEIGWASCAAYTVSYLCDGDDFCEWKNGSCQPAKKRKQNNSICTQYTTNKSCTDNGCYWFLNYCTDMPSGNGSNSHITSAAPAPALTGSGCSVYKMPSVCNDHYEDEGCMWSGDGVSGTCRNL